MDYHVEVDGHYYSVPHQLIKQLVTIRLTVNVVECLHAGQRVASHVRSYIKGKHTSLPEHMPVAHQRYSEWDPGHFLNWALDIGPCTHDVIQQLLNKCAHPEQGSGKR